MYMWWLVAKMLRKEEKQSFISLESFCRRMYLWNAVYISPVASPGCWQGKITTWPDNPLACSWQMICWWFILQWLLVVLLLQDVPHFFEWVKWYDIMIFRIPFTQISSPLVGLLYFTDPKDYYNCTVNSRMFQSWVYHIQQGVIFISPRTKWTKHGPTKKSVERLKDGVPLQRGIFQVPAVSF